MEIFWTEIDRWHNEKWARGEPATIVEAAAHIYGWAQQNGHVELHKAHATEIHQFIGSTVGGGPGNRGSSWPSINPGEP